MFKLGAAVIALVLSTTAINAHAQCAVTGTDPVPICRTTTNAPAKAATAPAKRIITHKNHR